MLDTTQRPKEMAMTKASELDWAMSIIVAILITQYIIPFLLFR